MERATVLLAEDDESVLLAVGDALEGAGYGVIRARSGKEALAKMKDAASGDGGGVGVDVLITDLWMPGIDGLAVLGEVKRNWAEVEVILITGNATVASAVGAMKAGAFDYLTKPFTPPELLEVVGRAVERRRVNSEFRVQNSDVIGGATELQGAYLRELVRGSPSLQDVAEKIRRVAGFKSTVLVTGESGVGKELVVRAIHELSPRAAEQGGGPLIAFNCAAVPAGLMESELFGHERGAFTGAAGRSAGYFEAADKGTLFIDEVGELEIGLQAKLLRALETGTITPVGSTREKRVDVRVIAATNSDLARAVEEKRFREDLYYRLNVVRIDVPPLRDRTDDLPALVEALLERLCREHGLKVPVVEAGTMEALARFRWPGNVRELRNVLESVLILGQKPVIAEADLPAAIRGAAGAGATGLSDLELAEKGAIERALKTSGGDRGRAAEMLGVSVRTLYRKMGRYGVR